MHSQEKLASDMETGKRSFFIGAQYSSISPVTLVFVPPSESLHFGDVQGGDDFRNIAYQWSEIQFPSPVSKVSMCVPTR